MSLSSPEPRGDVVLVEDNPDIAVLLQMLLTDAGFVVRLGRNGEEGLALLHERHPDVVLTDVEMPVLDGPSMATRMLVEDAGLERIPVVVISGTEELHRIAATVGTPYYLAKPFAPPQLVSLLHRALRERRWPRPSEPLTMT